MDAKDMPPKPAPPVAPQLPPQAFTKTDTGAVITAMVFFDVLNYFQASGDPTLFDALVDPTCKLCTLYKKQVIAIYSTGGFAIADGAVIVDPVISTRTDDALRVTGRLISKGAVAYNPGKSEITKSIDVDTQYVVDLAWNGQSWIITEAGIPSDEVKQ